MNRYYAASGLNSDRIASPTSDVQGNKIKIIVDEPVLDGALDFSKYSNLLAQIIENSIPKFSLGIFGRWGTGKTTLMKMIMEELKKNERILSVWFDAWRYEREQYLAVIPFLRTISITLANSKNKKGGWKDVEKGLERTFRAFVESTKLSVGFGSNVSIATDLGQFRNSLKSDGSAWIDGKIAYFNQHVSDYLGQTLDKLEHESPGSRIVVFVDDLDRCTPEKALEILESVKSFFDIKGIVYVIGMNYNSIDPLIRSKYGENSTVNGFDYMQKIVQLPFQIPMWNENDIKKFIDDTLTKNFANTDLCNNISNNTDLLVRGVKWNPREVKRFINNIILAESVFDKPIDQLIAVQALNFRTEWNKFFELITPDESRKVFLKEYEKFKQDNKIIDNKDIDKFNTEISQIYPSFKNILEAYPFFFKQGDSLRAFLDAGAIEKLQEIDKMEGYRRALDSVSLEGIPRAETEDESYSTIHDKRYAYEPSAMDKLENLVGLKQRKERGLLQQYQHYLMSLYSDGKLDENDIMQLNALRLTITDAHSKGKIGNENYTNLKNELSVMYQEIYKKRIAYLRGSPEMDVELRQTELAKLKEDITDAYSKGKIIELHYKLLYENFL